MRTIFLALLSVVCIVSAGAQAAPAPEATPQALSWADGVAYTYDGAGNIKRIGTDVQVYDAVGRLIRSDTNGIRRNYRYDAFGNRLSCTDTNGSDCQYGRQVTSTRNQLSGATYDPAGNLTKFDGHTYSYDAFNMQTRDQVDGTAVVREYIYTANDERIAVYVPGTGSWQWSLRDASGKVLREMTSSDPPAGTGTVGTASWSWVKDYVYREGLLVASRQLEPGAPTPTTYHYHLDHLGTPRQVTDDSGRIVGARSYHAFGPEQSDGRKDEPSPTRLKYTGHERDPELDYMHARYYDLKMGRFLSPDPVLDSVFLQAPRTWNRYSYVANNPLNLVDPTGLCGEGPDFIGPTKPCDFDFAMVVEVTEENPSEWEHMKWFTKNTTADMTPWGPLPYPPSDPWDLEAMYNAEQNPVDMYAGTVVGPFSIVNWRGYPVNLGRPNGPFQVLEGEQYAAARTAANNANRALHRADPSLAGKQIHEIQPVKFGGSPTDAANKVPLTPTQHTTVSTWWSNFLRNLLRPNG
jgi:RHS repeat-associated protein